ncbi:small multi-drug export protein [Bacillus shivajii]|uniref:small multi-drug export protein n=1 Tax=Bacillus shivajii TaxID=1983719 RepID=UPI001CF9C0B5|nr:small multi-drug export protein [Bacillus shivajii]UCZ54033.1 small multi-drug export protein [Bacillus shivajii]
MWEALWQYTVVFVMAATPWLEILFVIPIGIAMGLNPIIVAIVSFVGNFLPILLIVYAFKQIQKAKIVQRWKTKREAKRRKKEVVREGVDMEGLESETDPKKRTKKDRATAIFHKYGIPGLAIVGPILTGVHLAAVIALSLKADKHRTTFWMAVSLIAWTVLITVASYYGISWITNLL